MNILQITCHFHPNVGGVETHLNDLVSELVNKKHNVFVLTYRPLMANVKWKIYEKQKRLTIFRIPWIKGFFYKLVKSPVAEFLYLLPGLFIVLPFILIFKKIDVIHSHGLIAGFVAVFWGKIFGKRVITTTHSLYLFPEKGLYSFFAKWIFGNSSHVLTLSKQSKREIEKLGIDPDKITVFTYWIDLSKFKEISSKHKTKNIKKETISIKQKAKRELGWKYKFVVLFVGRLVEEKGILVLLEAAKKWNKNITLVIIGTGPLEKRIKNYELRIKNIKYIGKVENEKLPQFYNAADVTIVPSIHEEGFGRVILESLACGTPVIGSNRGAIPEAMDESVGALLNVSPEAIVKTVEKMYKNKKMLKAFSSHTRAYAEKYYGNKNIEVILNCFKRQ